MSYDPYNLHERDEKRADREEAAKLARLQDDADLRWIMGSRQGRRFVFRRLSSMGLYRSSYTGNSETFFREGMRNVGLQWMADIERVCQEEFIAMLKENQYARPDDTGSDSAK